MVLRQLRRALLAKYRNSTIFAYLVQIAGQDLSQDLFSGLAGL